MTKVSLYRMCPCNRARDCASGADQMDTGRRATADGNDGRLQEGDGGHESWPGEAVRYGCEDERRYGTAEDQRNGRRSHRTLRTAESHACPHDDDGSRICS